MARRKPTLRQRILASPIANAAKRVLYGRFYGLQRATAGMLSPAVYNMIYERVRAAPDLDTIEIGGANGSASIAVAWGKIDGGQASRHIVVERCEGGSRGRYGNYEDNIARFKRHLEQFGAQDRVTLYPHYLALENGPDVVALVQTGRIGGIISDADGRIDRDFSVFLPLVHPDGFIIVDDYHPSRSWKHALTYRLLNRFAEWNLFVLDRVRGGTAFGRPHPEADVARLDMAACAEIVRGVHADFAATAPLEPTFQVATAVD